MDYKVGTFREAGLECRWTKTRHGQPCIVAREGGEGTWWLIDQAMFNAMERDGILEGFRNCTLLGDIFSVSI